MNHFLALAQLTRPGGRQLAELTGALAGRRWGRLCPMLGTRLSGRSAGAQICLADSGGPLARIAAVTLDFNTIVRPAP